MQPDSYPPQDPLSPPAKVYHDEVMRRGAAVAGDEVRYGEDPYQSLLVCRAEKPSGTMLAFLHGGGWTNGYKEWMAFMAPAFTKAGITFASIGYRLAPAHLFPVGFQDACAGMAWLADHAADYGATRDGLFVGGHSAGGHYAALMALTRPALRLRGCLPLSGVFDFGPQSGLTMRPRFLGTPESDTERPASPIAQIGAAPGPFLIAYGSKDFPHLVTQGERMAAALAAAGGDVEVRVLAERDHFTASYACGEADGPWVPAAIDWMKRR